MKKLVIQSHNEAEDRQAASIINEHLKKDDSGEIIWFSNLGAKVARMEDTAKIVEKMEGVVERLECGHHRLANQCATLQVGVDYLEKTLKEIQESITKQENLFKNEENLKKEKNK